MGGGPQTSGPDCILILCRSSTPITCQHRTSCPVGQLCPSCVLLTPSGAAFTDRGHTALSQGLQTLQHITPPVSAVQGIAQVNHVHKCLQDRSKISHFSHRRGKTH